MEEEPISFVRSTLAAPILAVLASLSLLMSLILQTVSAILWTLRECTHFLVNDRFDAVTHQHAPWGSAGEKNVGSWV
jgi:hypothetical protein